AAEERRHLRARLGEAEDVVHEEENVPSLDVAEVLGDGEGGQTHPGTGAGRLVHLAVDEHGLGLLELLEVDDPTLAELRVEVVSLAGPLTHAGEPAEATLLDRGVPDELGQEHRLAHAGAAEEAGLAAAGVGAEQVHDLDAGLEDLHPHVLVGETRGWAVDR